MSSETPSDMSYFTPPPEERAMTLSPSTETPSHFREIPYPSLDFPLLRALARYFVGFKQHVVETVEDFTD